MGGDEGDGDGAPSPSHPLVREGLKMRMVKRQGGGDSEQGRGKVGKEKIVVGKEKGEVRGGKKER